MELVALLSTGKGSWNEVNQVIENGEWEKVILIGNEFAKKFNCSKKADFVLVNLDSDVDLLREEITSKLKSKIEGIEVALSIASGTGKEHIALISALMNVPAGIKFISFSEKGMSVL